MLVIKALGISGGPDRARPSMRLMTSQLCFMEVRVFWGGRDIMPSDVVGLASSSASAAATDHSHKSIMPVRLTDRFPSY